MLKGRLVMLECSNMDVLKTEASIRRAHGSAPSNTENLAGEKSEK